MVKKTAQQRAGEAVLSRLVSEVDGAGFSFRSDLVLCQCHRVWVWPFNAPPPLQGSHAGGCVHPQDGQEADHEVCWAH